MTILVKNHQQKVRVNIASIKRTAKHILSTLGYHDVEVSLLLVDNEEIAVLNQKYLQRSYPTDVLAFPMREGEFGQINPEVLGDVVISVEMAEQVAEERKGPVEDEIKRLLIHGILHLLGYDHEMGGAKARQMRTREKELFEELRDKKIRGRAR